jgi:hypothetical protein
VKKRTILTDDGSAIEWFATIEAQQRMQCGGIQTDKLQHGRGFQRIFALKGASVLGFAIE